MECVFILIYFNDDSLYSDSFDKTIFRFSSIAAERINSPNLSVSRHSNQRESHRSVARPSSVQKTAGQRRRHGRNDRSMDIDTTSSDKSKPQNRNNNSQRRKPESIKPNNRRRPNSGRGRRDEKKPVSQGDLDRELDAYMMKNSATARATLDMDLDAYMSAAPPKTA